MKSLIFLAAALSMNMYSVAQKFPKGYKLVYEQTFDKGVATEDFEFTDESKWLISEGNPGKALEFTGQSDYQPPFRSPFTIGLVKDIQVGSFILEVDMLQTGKEYGHRDMCVIFGFRDASHFYYSHIATKGDDNAHQIMLVNNAPRTKISTFTTEGVDWGQNSWHKVRVERDVEKGSIKVFFDGVLIEEASDKLFSEGHIGFGSFDDSGKIDNVRVWAKKKQATSKSSFFK